MSNVLGNLSLSLGMRNNQGPLLKALLNPWVLGGIGLLILWTLSRMALLSWADLSYVVPVTAVGYVLNALMGRFYLSEQVSAERWAGTVLIMGGAALVGMTVPGTTRR